MGALVRHISHRREFRRRRCNVEPVGEYENARITYVVALLLYH